MTDAELLDELAALGVDESSWRAVLLLPMVQVAWADGRIQPRELRLLRDVAAAYGLADGPTGVVLERWLTEPPSPEVVARGRAVLVHLAHRHRGLGADLPEDLLDTIQAFCLGVARAAGGLFDVLFTVDARERAALDEIARSLADRSDDLLADLPSPDGGRFRDL